MATFPFSIVLLTSTTYTISTPSPTGSAHTSQPPSLRPHRYSLPSHTTKNLHLITPPLLRNPLQILAQLPLKRLLFLLPPPLRTLPGKALPQPLRPKVRPHTPLHPKTKPLNLHFVSLKPTLLHHVPELLLRQPFLREWAFPELISGDLGTDSALYVVEDGDEALPLEGGDECYAFAGGTEGPVYLGRGGDGVRDYEDGRGGVGVRYAVRRDRG